MRYLLFSLLLGTVMYGGEIKYHISAPEVAYASVKGYTMLKCKSYTRISHPGAPSLPYKVLKFIIPATAEIEKIKIENIDSSITNVSSSVFPAQKPIPLMSGITAEFTPPDPGIYNKKEKFPGNLAKILHTGNLSGFRIAQISVYPVQYIPVEGTILTYSFDLIISFRENKLNAKTLTETQYRIFSKEVKELVLNPEMISVYAPPIRRR